MKLENLFHNPVNKKRHLSLFFSVNSIDLSSTVDSESSCDAENLGFKPLLVLKFFKNSSQAFKAHLSVLGAKTSSWGEVGERNWHVYLWGEVSERNWHVHSCGKVGERHQQTDSILP